MMKPKRFAMSRHDGPVSDHMRAQFATWGADYAKPKQWITADRDDYLDAMTEALAIGTAIPAAAITNTCPECGIENPEDDLHATAEAGTGSGYRAVVIGCEGYWVIDPKLVGIDAPNWEPAR